MELLWDGGKKVCSNGPGRMNEPDDHWSCIANLSVEGMFKSAVIEEKKFKNIESE